MRGNLKGHIVIINHSQRADDLIRQLHAQRIRNKRPVVVVSHSPVSFSSEAEFNDVFTVTGDVIDKAVLVEAQVERAHSVAILSAWPPPDPNDRRQSLLSLTDDGLRQLEQVRDHITRQFTPYIERFAAEEAEAVHIGLLALRRVLFDTDSAEAELTKQE